MSRPNVTVFLGSHAHIAHLAPVVDHLLQRADLDVSVVHARDFMTPPADINDAHGRRDLHDEARAFLRGADIVLAAETETPQAYGMVDAAIECARVPVLLYRPSNDIRSPMVSAAQDATYLVPDEKSCETLINAGFNAHAVGRPRYDRYAQRDIPGLAALFRESLPDGAQDKNILVFHGEALANAAGDTFITYLVDAVREQPDVFLVYRGPRDAHLLRRLNDVLGDRWVEDPNAPVDTAMAGGDQHIAHMHPVLNDVMMLNAWSARPLGMSVSMTGEGASYPFFSAQAGVCVPDAGTLGQTLRHNFTELARRRAWTRARALVDNTSASRRIARVIDARLGKQGPA